MEMGVRQSRQAVIDSHWLAVFTLLVIYFPHHLAAQNTEKTNDLPTTCPLGFYGNDCSRVCQSDQDCATEDSETCYSGFAFLKGYPTVAKVFSCTTTSPDLVTNLIEPGSVRVQCYAVEVAKASNCSFTFGIVDYANPVSCEAVQCDTGGNTITCSSIGCECVSDKNCSTGSTFVKAFVSGVQGPASFTCEQQDEEGSCTLNVPEFLVPEIGVTCSTGQCLPQPEVDGEETNAPSLEYSGTSVNVGLNACLAAIPTIVLCLVSVMVLLYWLKISTLYDMLPSDVKNGALPQGEAGYHCLTWTNLSVHVHLSPKRKSQKQRDMPRFPGKMMNLVSDKDKISSKIKIPNLRATSDGDESRKWAILSDCSGEAPSGEVVGLLGPSGCGKTTLLSALSGDSHGMLKQMRLVGNVRLDEARMDPKRVQFVPQMDTLIPTMTVREQLLFAGVLKLDLPKDLVKQRVQTILEELGIDGISEEYVGGSANIRGISGGERRRVTIGIALVSDPECVVLDEPLSGLDSYNALIVTSIMKSLAKRGRVVLYSMHQPSDELFNSLDRVIFLAHGRTVYQGSPAGARQVLSSLDISVVGKPIADSMIDVLSNTDTLLKILGDAKNPAEGSGPLAAKGDMSWKDCDKKTPGICLQTTLLFNRTFRDMWRNRSLLVLHVVISICAGLIVGGIFYDVSLNTDGVQARYGSIFISLSFLAFTSITSIDLLINERMVVTAEIKEGLYNGSLYVLSKLFLDGLLLRALPATLYTIPFYFMVGFVNDAARFFSFLFILILFNLCIGALAMLVTICSRTAGTSLFVMNTLLLLQLSLTGFLVEVDSITPVLRWIHWLSQFYYAFEAMITTEMNQNKYNLILEAPGLKPIILENTPGEMFIDTLGYEVDTATRNIGILIGYYYGFVCLCLVAFYIRINWNWGPEWQIFQSRQHAAYTRD
eukprot:jgi/Picsp_1/6713/NSC_04055-R1_atp-binding cassette sub-family g member 2